MIVLALCLGISVVLNLALIVFSLFQHKVISECANMFYGGSI